MMSVSPGGNVTADDVDEAVGRAVAMLRAAPEDGWERAAGPLEWTCWETAEHLADDLFAYAAQLGLRTGPPDRYVPFVTVRRRPGGPANTVRARREDGPGGLLQVLQSCGALLASAVRNAAPDARGHHTFGASNAEGFAAMGVVETLLHADDLARGLGLGWAPPQELCARSLARLFPDVTAAPDAPWDTLRWATGRTALPTRPRRTAWRWYGAPAGEGNGG